MTQAELQEMTTAELREYVLNRASDKKIAVFEEYERRVRQEAFRSGVRHGRGLRG